MHPERDTHLPTPEDQFDAWLDAFVAGPSTPAPNASASTSSDPALDAAKSTARQVHELAETVDRAETRVTAAIRPSPPTWEEILMASTPTPLPVAVPVALPTPIPSTAGHRSRPRSSRMDAVNRLISIAAILALLIAGASTAWLNRDRFGFNNNQPLLQLAASPTVDVTCTTHTLSKAEVDRIVAKYQDTRITEASLTPTNNPVPEADALAAIATYRALQSCPFGDPSVDSMRWLRSAETEGNLAMHNLAQSPAWTADRLAAYKPMLEPLSRMLVPPPSSAYVVDSDDPSIEPYLIDIVGSGSFAMLPATFVQFPDGRIGAPLLRATSGGASQGKDLSRLTVTFIIFRMIDGRWLVDSALNWLCPEDCSAAQGQLDEQIASYRSLATAAASPEATPEASPKP